MITINLLPSQRAKQLKARRAFHVQMLTGSGILVVTVLVCWFVSRALSQDIALREHDVQVKTSQLATLKAKAKEVEDLEQKQEVLKRHTRILDNLKKEQKNPVHLLDTVSRSLDPLKLWLVRMNVTNKRVQIEGRALTNFEIVQFVRNLHRTKQFDKIWLEESRAGKEDRFTVFQFKLRMVWRGKEAA